MRKLLAALARLLGALSGIIGLLAFVWVAMMVYMQDTGRFMTSVLTAATLATALAVGLLVLSRRLVAQAGDKAHQDELDSVVRIMRENLSYHHVLPQLQRIGFSNMEQNRLGIMSEGKAGWLSLSINTNGEIFSAVYAPSSGGQHTTIVEAQAGGHGKVI